MDITITPNLWFDANAEEAAEFYCATIPNSRILNVMRYTEAGPGPEGSAVTVDFELNGQRFTGLNGGPAFHFTEAVSFVIETETQADTDRLWDALTADGGQEGNCGWLKDKFGLSWQVYPRELGALVGDSDPERAARATRAMLAMHKIDVDAIRAAAEKA